MRIARPTWIWIATVGAVLSIAVVARTVHDRRRGDDDAHGHGGVESALTETTLRQRQLPPERRLPDLLEQWRSPDPLRRFAALEHLVERDEPEAAAAVLSGLPDNFSRVRQRTVERAMDVAPQKGWEILARGLHDEDDWVREAASMQVSLRMRRKRVPDPPAYVAPALVAALDDESEVVRVGASSALFKLAKNPSSPPRIRPRTVDARSREIVARWKAWLSRRPERGASVPLPIDASRTDPAPDYAFTTLDGESVDAAGRAGKVTILHFWGTWCGPCQVEMPGLERLHRRFAGRGVGFYGLAIAEKDGEAGVRRWVRNRRITFPQALCPEPVADAFGDIREVPVSVLIDRAGRVRYRWDGEREPSTLAKTIERVLREDG